MRIVRFSEPVIHLVSTAFHRTGGGQEGGQGWGGGRDDVTVNTRIGHFQVPKILS